ncbi:MAG: hypothetical protein Q9173_006684 [Seirophora scorigena]
MRRSRAAGSISDSASNGMPPPLSPSTLGSSLLGKRKRAHGSSADLREASHVHSGPSSFSETVKDYIETANGGDSCWCCNAGVIQFCHIIPRGDRKMFRELRRRGLLSITTLHAPANGVALCPTCHILFDAHQFPGWVFLPADLQYFVDFENEDFERRQQHHNDTGEWPVRAVPLPQNYRQHQADLIPQGAVGGLYRKLFFHSRFRINGEDRSGESAEYPPKVWLGDPLAALNRAFNSLGSQAHLFPVEIKQQLRDLQDLYGTHDRMTGAISAMHLNSKPASMEVAVPTSPDQPQASCGVATTFNFTPPQLQGEPLRFVGQADDKGQPQEITHTRKRARSEVLSPSRSSEDLSRGSKKRHRTDKHIPWIWGPNATSEEKSKFYRGIYKIRATRRPSHGIQKDIRDGENRYNSTKIAEPEGNQPEVKEVMQSVLPSPQASAG